MWAQFQVRRHNTVRAAISRVPVLVPVHVSVPVPVRSTWADAPDKLINERSYPGLKRELFPAQG